MSPWIEIPSGGGREVDHVEPQDTPSDDLASLIVDAGRALWPVILIVNREDVELHIMDEWIAEVRMVIVACCAQSIHAEPTTIVRRLVEEGGGLSIFGVTKPTHVRDKQDLIEQIDRVTQNGLETLSRPRVLTPDNGRGRDMVVLGVGDRDIVESFAAYLKEVYRPRRFVLSINPYVPIEGAMIVVLYELRDSELSDLGLSEEQWARVKEEIRRSLHRRFGLNGRGGQAGGAQATGEGRGPSEEGRS